jgi:2-C-methyl-D-erythritol 4-phosphate cytidylyltransferase
VPRHAGAKACSARCRPPAALDRVPPGRFPPDFTEGVRKNSVPGTLNAIPISRKDTNLRTAAVIPAAGRGVRLGPGAPKALRTLGGVPILVHAVRAMARARAVQVIVVVAPPEGAAEVRALLDAHGLPESTDIRVVPGGELRQDSVRLGLAALPDDVDVVLVHDAARPLVPVETVEAVVDALRAGALAVVPGLPLADTVKSVDPVTGTVTGTPQRALLRAVQTPQGFDRATLAKAHATVTEDVTDDAGMVEQLGVPVLVVPGHEEAFKVTRPLDLVLAEAVLARRRANGY